ncbi:MAG: hypothetical protein A3F17_07780 [Gammaproteobacteria bacterium RIFCSPHIGHO2_12_FULL_41_15]|nr:MAG: hypothetical protein A3F17_07780 [Gammaproteobacteria bacterium RIFCSPHIGHO2_12_FULL_41_15]
MKDDNLKETLVLGLEKMGLKTDPVSLLAYLDLLAKWNQTYNLTAIRNPLDMVSKHILDSLAVVPYIKGDIIADVGTGAGLPGIPLALYFANKKVFLFESIGKKVRFLENVVRTLKLANVEVVHGRVEDYQGKVRFDTVISRAVGSIAELIKWTAPLIMPNGRWLFMKGESGEDECAILDKAYTRYNYQLPYLKDARCIICIEDS